jgi:hypothetical protein
MTGARGATLGIVAVALLAAACARPAAPPPTAGAAPEGPVLAALVEATRAAGTLSVVGTNGSQVTWRSADGIGMTFDRGVLFATRGLGADLYTAETAPVLERWPAGTYARTVRHLDGENRIIATRLECRLADRGATEVEAGGRTYAVRHAVETCAAPGLPDIRNDYWREADGTMRQSRQWIAPALGHVTVQRLGG